MAKETNRRKLWIIALSTCLLVPLSALVALQAFNLKFLNPATTEQIFVFTGLSIVAFLLLVTVLILLARNVLKLYAEQRSRVMGTRLRTRMLVGAILVSLLPISFMAFFSYGLMNRAVDRWFSQPVTQMRDASNQLALDLAQYTTANARAEADSIASSLPAAAPGEAPDNAERRNTLLRILSEHEITLQNGFAIIYDDGKPIVSFQMPEPDGASVQLKSWMQPSSASGATGERAAGRELPNASMDAEILSASRRSGDAVLGIGTIDYALGTSPLKTGETVVVGLPMPDGMSSTMASLRTAAQSYWTIHRSRNQIRNLYMLLLLMMTCLALFASSWLALHLSKQVTKPVEALADAMESIASEDYAHRVDESATEELGELVRSFNHMASDLESSRSAVERSTIQLSEANIALEARRSELETMLETIPNGVATLDTERRIVLANRALSEMIDPGGQRPFIGRLINEVFPQDVVEVLDRLVNRSHRMGSASSEIEVTGIAHDAPGGTLNLLATIALLETPTAADGTRREHRGYVLVIENATELLRAQKQSAWKEVARRVAHEIKNPLTPISLSAEQIHRHVNRLDNLLEEREIQSPSTAIIRRCSEVITSSVESMRSLVDQFASLAEFPTARPQPADLNTIVENALALFAGRMTNIRVIRKLETGLPLVMADPEALKRALTNLIDNAAEAMQLSLLRELTITTMLLENNTVELSVADTGSGLTDEMRERLFLPYFSTKQRGTGLGLAIASKIIQEHQGTIRAEQNEPVGSRFIIELRTASSVEPASDPLVAANSNGGRR